MPAPNIIMLNKEMADVLDRNTSMFFWERTKLRLMVKSEIAFGDNYHHLYKATELDPDRFCHVFKEQVKEKAIEMFSHL